MEMKLIDGGIYNIRNFNNKDDYVIIVKQEVDRIILIHPRDFFLSHSKFENINTRDDINEIISGQLMNNTIFTDDFVSTFPYLQDKIFGYLGQIDEDYLKELRKIIAKKFSEKSKTPTPLFVVGGKLWNTN